MDSKNHDPNNHVPEVSPEDDWADVELTEEEQIAARKKLPKKRNDDLRRPKMLQPREFDVEPPQLYVSPELDEDDYPVVERLEVAENPNAVKKQQRVRTISDSDEAPRRAEPSGTAVHKPAETVVRREGDQWGTQTSHPVRWMVISAVLVLVILVTGIVVRPYIMKKTVGNDAKNDYHKIVVDEPEIVYDPADFDMGGNTVAEAQQMMAQYATAKTLDEVLPMIRNSKELEPILRKEWKPLNIASGWATPDSAEWTLRKVDNRDFACLSGSFPNLSTFQYYFLRDHGKLLIDWEASTGHGYKTFKELAKGGTEGGIIRAEVSVSEMYTFSMPEEQYVSIRMAGPGRETLLWGYLKRGTEVEDRFRRLFTPGLITRQSGNEYRVTLRIAPAPPDSLPNQWIIAEFLHIDWLNP
ncbi:hypothetical protein JIN85_08040 [Luteolibacter pohnpeiensis]|uniref:Uncharacterized protein n=1 Tax=Luteolibacter pohnpeiensis TaxID=454153 RepID=A0A934S6V7_9BACT|nr:hypothetical protein [Luteolibacter pohnpeiensis]MBK1882360.1 hypothetical protein [Luteolibacter pohnpeiensis]